MKTKPFLNASGLFSLIITISKLILSRQSVNCMYIGCSEDVLCVGVSSFLLNFLNFIKRETPTQITSSKRPVYVQFTTYLFQQTAHISFIYLFFSLYPRRFTLSFHLFSVYFLRVSNTLSCAEIQLVTIVSHVWIWLTLS